MVENLISSGWTLLIYLGAFALMILILVSAHEYGHFLAARLFGVRVLRFSTGFGPALMAWHDRRGTEYRIGALPLGGYVLMQSGEEAEAKDFPGESYKEASLFARLMICFAGPAANLVLAFLLQAALLSYGMPGFLPTIGPVEPDSAAEVAGLRSGDRITRVGGSKIATVADLRIALVRQAGGDSATLTVERTGLTASSEELELRLPLQALDDTAAQRDPLKALGMSALAYESPRIGRVFDGSPAARAGLVSGDMVLAVDEQQVRSWSGWVELIQASPGRTVQVRVLRGDEERTLQLTPERSTLDGREIGRAGVSLGVDDSLRTVRRAPLWQAPGLALVQVYNLTALTVGAIVDLLTGQLSLDNLSGPVGIAQISGQAAQISAVAFIMLMSLLSISLGVINLVPLPVLDGGRAALHLIEGALRRPLPTWLEGALNMAGLLIITTLMLFTIVQDISRL